MSAERLREAAKVLRERAEAATPGEEWAVGNPRFGESDTSIRVKFAPSVTAVAHVGTKSNAVFVATMSPEAALDVADWLAALAEFAEPGVRAPGLTEALGFANRILGAIG